MTHKELHSLRERLDRQRNPNWLIVACIVIGMPVAVFFFLASVAVFLQMLPRLAERPLTAAFWLVLLFCFAMIWRENTRRGQ